MRNTLVLGVFPGMRTWRGIQVLVESGGERIVQEIAPIAPSTDVMLFVVIGVWATAWLVDTAARSVGSPPFAIVVGIPLLLTPGLLVPSTTLWLDAGAFLLAAGALLWLEDRARGPRSRSGRGRSIVGPLGVLALAGVILFVSVPNAPGFGEPSLLKTRSSGGVAFNPITALRPTLSDRTGRRLFFVTTDTPGYMRLTALDEFDGETFRQSGLSTASRLTLSERGIDPEVPDVAFRDVVQQVQLTRLAGSWLPAQADPFSVEALAANVLYEADTSALVVLPTVPRTESYVVRSRVRIPNARELDALSDTEARVSRRFLELPRVSSELRALAADIVGDASTPYRRATAIQAHLRTFTYDLEVAATHDLRTIEQFLTTVRSGYCEQFATTMAVLARIVGIPSRVNIGFTPGEVVSRGPDGRRTYLVTTLDAHAWPELWIEGAGWVPFEPTPRSGFTRVPEYSVPPAAAPLPTTNPTPTPTSLPSASPSGLPSARPTSDVSPDGGVPLSIPVSAPVLWSVVVAAALVAIGRAAWPRVQRRSGKRGIPLGYRQFLGFCADVGLGRRPGETPREHAARVAAIPGIEPLPIRAIAEAAGRALYGPPMSVDLVAEGNAAREAVGRVVPRGQRIRARLRANLSLGSRV